MLNSAKFSQFIKNASKTPEAKGALVLTVGSAVAQLSNLLFYPFLTRLYSPSQFGELSVVMLLMVFCSMVFSYQLHLFLPVTEEQSKAQQLVQVSFGLSLLFFLLTAFGAGIVYLLGFNIKFNEIDLTSYLLIFPFLVGIYSLNEVAKVWNNRQRSFLVSVVGLNVNRTSCNVFRLALSPPHLASTGLVAGELVGNLISFLLLLFSDLKLRVRPILSFAKIWAALRPKGRVYTINLVNSLLAVASVELPILLLSFSYSGDQLGQYALAYRLTLSPILVFASAFGSATLKKVSELSQTNGPHAYTLRLFMLSLVGTSALALVGYFLAQPLFAIFFSDQWKDAADYAQLLVFFIVAKPMSVLGSHLAMVIGRVDLIFWQVVTLVALVIGVYAVTGSLVQFIIWWVALDLLINASFFMAAYFAKAKGTML